MNFQYFVVATLVAVVSAGEPLVNITNGPILGAQHTTDANTTYYGFHGLPFAKPPLSELRFMSPQSPDNWTETLNATVDRSFCVSAIYSSNSANEAEDCLYLNVYTPDLTPSEALPVMIFFFPGAFVYGNASFSWLGPQYIMERQNVIFVSVQYRLGPFGWLSTNDSSIPGNAGWKDMVKAVEWVYDNIAAFGGDPEKITLSGCSAGGASTGLLTMNEKVKGKFRATIEMSGSDLAIWTVNSDPTYFLTQYLTNLNQSALINDTEQAKTYLQNLTVVELMSAYSSTNPLFTAYPVIEPESDDAFFTHYHYEQIQCGNYTQVPALVGVTSGEALYFLEDLASTTAFAQQYDAGLISLVPSNLKTNESNYDAVISDIKSIYLGDNETWTDNLPAFSDYISDHYMRKAVFKLADLRSQFNEVYLYVFDYYGERHVTPAFLEGASKVGHAGDLPYLTHTYPFVSTNETDLLVQARMTTLFTNFVINLNPTPETNDLLQNVTWPQYSADDTQYLYITENLAVESDFNKAKFDAWYSIYETYAEEIGTY